MNKMVNWFLAMLLLSAVACSSNSSDNHKTIFNINLDDGLTSLDPAFARNQNAIWMDNQLYNGLVLLDDNLKVKPCIAKSWEISADGLQYTFHLRNDVYFQNDRQFKYGLGRKVTAADFVYSFGRLIDTKVGSSGSWIFSDIARYCHMKLLIFMGKISGAIQWGLVRLNLSTGKRARF